MSRKYPKTASEENFPVGKLVKKSLRPLVAAYYKAARLADDIADSPDMDSSSKLARLKQIEEVFAGCREDDSLPEIMGLRQLFKTENLDASLYTDLLEAFRRDAAAQPIEIWEQLLDYCSFSAAPVGRFMLAIHNENPSAYLPASVLCAVLQIVNHLQDVKEDASELRRVYFPAELLRKHNVYPGDFCLAYSTEPVHNLINDVVSRLRKMLKDAEILPAIVRNRRLKAEISVILSLTNSMLKKIDKGDVLSRKIKLSRWDWVKAFIFGFTRGFLCKTKTIGLSHEQH